MILLNLKKIIIFITNAYDKNLECLTDVTKTMITGKTILTESKLETEKLNMTINGAK